MARIFQNPVNNHAESVDFGSSVAAFLLGFIYLAYKGLWSHVFIWLVLVIIPSVLSGGILSVLTVPFAALLYAFCIQGILARRYLNQGWSEVGVVGAKASYEDRELAASTAAILAGPDPMLPRPSIGTKASDVKLCPFCAEEVKVAAVRCKHCQADISVAEGHL
jgi:hypothetical protein